MRSWSSLVFGLDLKCLVLCYLLLTCAAPTHAQKYLGKNTFIYLFVSPIDAGIQKCTQGKAGKGRERQKKTLFEIGKLIFEIRKQVLCKHLCRPNDDAREPVGRWSGA